MSWWNPFSWFKSEPTKSTEQILIEEVARTISGTNEVYPSKTKLDSIPVETVSAHTDIDDMYESMIKKNAEIRKKHTETITKKTEDTYVPVFTPSYESSSYSSPSYESPSFNPPSFDAGGGESGGGGSSDSF